MLRLPLLSLCALTCAQAGQTFRPLSGAYGPSQDVVIKRPCLRLEIWASDGREVTVSEMRVDGQVVPATYSTKDRALLYPCDKPLPEGEHAVECRVGFSGTPVYKTGWKFRVLPDAIDGFPAANPDQTQALKIINGYRRRLKLADMVGDPVLDLAAAGHSDYCAKNNVLGHVERPGLPGFTGQTSLERLARLGWIGISFEGMTSGEETLEGALASLFDSPYHRLPFIQPGAVAFGSGRSKAMTTIEVGGATEAGTVTSPGEDQTEVPTSWGRIESPDPLRIHPDANLPLGYPIVVALFGPDRHLTGFTATLKTAAGKDVPVFLNTPENDNEITTQAFVIPKDPLAPKTTYEIGIKATDEKGTPIEKTWRFTTTSKH